MEATESSKSASDTKSASHEGGRVFASVKTFVIISTTAAIALAVFRNALTWHLQRFWGASGDLWQSVWDRVQDSFSSEQRMATLGTTLFSLILFWSFNLFFFAVDYLKPSWAMQYKIQDKKAVQWNRVGKVCIKVLFNQIVVGGTLSVFAYRLSKWRGCNFERTLPTFGRVAAELFVCVWIEEVLFYYSHRLLHNHHVYKHIHKVHHEWSAPIGIVSIYAHPVEHVLANIVPVATGPLLCGSHLATSWLWYALALFSTTVSHCGYHFPFLPSPEAHDYHHLAFTQCYGVLGVLDRLHGTDSHFRQTRAYDRHFLSLSLVPVKKLYPDHKEE